MDKLAEWLLRVAGCTAAAPQDGHGEQQASPPVSMCPLGAVGAEAGPLRAQVHAVAPGLLPVPLGFSSRGDILSPIVGGDEEVTRTCFPLPPPPLWSSA